MSSLLYRSPRAPRRSHSSPSSASSMHAVTSLAVPALTVGTLALQDVPENSEVRLHVPSAQIAGKGSGGMLPKNQDWIRLQHTIRTLFREENATLKPGELAVLHESIRSLSSSKAAPFIYDYFKHEVEKCMTALREKLRKLTDDELLKTLGEAWEKLFTKILPILELILYSVKTKGGGLNTRQTLLVAFRDFVVTKLDLECVLDEMTGPVPQKIKQMLLVLYSVNDTYPPTKCKLKLETLVARVVSPFLGFLGLYEGSPEPIIRSCEPELAAKRKSVDGQPLQRKISRPMSVQPRQMETLSELFLTAIRKHDF